jgi:predicted NACHT family NTPase
MIQIDYSKIISNLIQKNIENVFNGVYKHSEKKYKEHILQTGKAFESYLNTSVEKFNNVKTILYSHKPMPLYQFYVDVNLKCGDDRISTHSIKPLLEYSHFVTIFGSGGTGKSTLFKHLFLDTIRDSNLIPIFVELKNMNDKNYKCIEDFIYDSLKNLNFSLEKDFFLKSLSNGKYVIFLDGFDEVKEKQKTMVSDEIIRFTNQYRDNYYILSSRKSEDLERGWDNFSDFTVEPLNKPKACQLISNLIFDDEVKERFLYQLMEGDLFTKHHSFCSNPLMLTIMLLTYQEFAEIPDKLHIFYGRAFDVLYSKHDATKGSFVREKRFEKNGLASDDFQNILSAFSAISYADSQVTFEQDSLMAYIKQAKDFTELDFSPNDFRADLVEAVCILTIDGSEYKYQHRSFQEYFTAKFINNLTDEDQKEFLTSLFEGRFNSIRTDEVFNMLFEMNQVKLEQNFIIPQLEELIAKTLDCDEMKARVKFLSLIFSTVRIHPDDKNRKEPKKGNIGFKTTLSIKERQNFRYFDLVRFITSKYHDKYSDLSYVLEISYKDKQDKISEIFDRRTKSPSESTEDQPFIRLSIDEAFNDKRILDDILVVNGKTISYFIFSKLVLEKLKEKYANKKSMRDLFLRLNK